MEFEVQDSKKKEIHKLCEKNKTSLRIIRGVENVMLLISAGIIVWVIYCLFMPGVWEETFGPEQVVRKAYFMIFALGTIFLGGSMTAWLLVRVLRGKVASLGLGERIDESLSIDQGCLFYTFRLKYQSMPTDRSIVAVKLDEMECVVYDKTIKKLIIRGKIFEKWCSNFTSLEKVDISKTENGEFVLYDYFSPSLKELLEQNTVKIESKE